MLRRRGLSQDEAVRAMQELADEAGIGDDNVASVERELPGEVSFEALTQALDEMVDAAEAVLEERSGRLQALAAERLAQLPGS